MAADGILGDAALMRNPLRLRPRRVNSLSVSMVIAAAGAGIIIGGSFLTAHSLGASALTSASPAHSASASHALSARALSNSATTRTVAVPTADADDMTPAPLIVRATPAPAVDNDKDATETVDNDNEATEPADGNDANEPGDDNGGVQPTSSPSSSSDDGGSSGGSGSGGDSGSGDSGSGH